MANKIHKIRARMKYEVAEIRRLVKHSMETGNRNDPVIGTKIPRHFIREFRCEYDGAEVLSADWGWGVSRNPYLSFRLTGAKPGDAINATWVDNKGVSGSIETQSK